MSDKTNIGRSKGKDRRLLPDAPSRHVYTPYKKVCADCGAIRIDKQLGLEETPEEYIDKMVAIFREVWRVMRDDGTLWLNMGDCYNGSGKAQGQGEGTNFGKPLSERPYDVQKATNVKSLKPKDLVGMPWRLAFALQADGWYLRSDIIWSKPNPMPESCTDRPTKAHEYVFLMSKQARYYYDADAVREAHSEATLERIKYPHHPSDRGGGTSQEHGHGMKKGGARDYMVEKGQAYYTNPQGRNRRTVWTIPTQPYSEAHFATFPPKLVIPCIKAGTKKEDTVLDPFMGSGTVAEVCERYGRAWIGIELSQEYCDIAVKRIEKEARQMKLAIT